MSKKEGKTLTGLGLRNKVRGAPITGIGIREKTKGTASIWSKKKDGATEEEQTTTRPLQTLKDPSSFGPPPRNVHYQGGATHQSEHIANTRGLGAPLSQDEIYHRQQADEEDAQRQWEAEEDERNRRPPPNKPFRADTSGLSTSHLPPPPIRRETSSGRLPAPTPPSRGATPISKGGPPGLPPRLPPRQNSTPIPSPSAEPDSHSGILNQSSLNRLGAAGVSVPGLGIGANGRQAILPPPPPARSPAPADNNPQLNELQSRFSRMSTSTSPKTETPSQGTTWAQKQAAIKTASSFRNDPSSVSLSDARSAASTANNFRDRHGDQVKSGWQAGNKLNTKYGIADKVQSYGGTNNQAEAGSPQIEMKDNSGVAPLGKKKPPPPPPKKKSMTGTAVGATPPPIPLSSKPKPRVSYFEQ